MTISPVPRLPAGAMAAASANTPRHLLAQKAGTSRAGRTGGAQRHDKARNAAEAANLFPQAARVFPCTGARLAGATVRRNAPAFFSSSTL